MLHTLLRRALVWGALADARLRFLAGGITAVAERVPSLSRPQLAAVLRRYGARIGEAAELEPGLVIHNAKGDFAHLTVGGRAHIGRQALLDLAAPITIGDAATISMRCMILTHQDVGRSPLAHRPGFARAAAGVEIGGGAYLGAGVTVLMGVTIGAEAVVGAGAVVREDVPPHTVAVGVPSRIVRTVE